MSRVVYFDCFSGISGDMVIGACLDAGLPFEALTTALGTLAMSGYDVKARRVLRCGVSATKFDVIDHAHPPEQADETRGHSHVHDQGLPHDHAHPHTHDHAHPHHDDGHHHGHRQLTEIFDLIDRSALSPSGRERARALFRPARGGGGRHSPDADRAGPSARGRARSTPSSTSSEPCSRWNGSAPSGSSVRRSTSAAAWCDRRTACFRCRRRRRAAAGRRPDLCGQRCRRNSSRRPAP